MSIYRINPVGGGSGFKVNVSDDTGGLRVVGIFSSETAAAAWITVDRGITETPGSQIQSRTGPDPH